MLLRTALLLTTLGAAAGAQAQTPPIKPGLWELQNTGMSHGGQSVDMAQAMKNMPPEARKRMEEVMKQKGMDLSGGIDRMKVCLDKASLDQGNWRGTQHGCTTDVKERSGNTWKWRATCTNPPSETVGEAVFASPEAYSVKAQSTVTRGAQKHTMDVSVNGRWLGADCGGLKPMSEKTLNTPPQTPR
jgi:hypothetical protein